MISTKTGSGSDTDIIFQNRIGSDSESPLSNHLWFRLRFLPQIHQNESNTFSKLFLLKWLFLRLKWYR